MYASSKHIQTITFNFSYTLRDSLHVEMFVGTAAGTTNQPGALPNHIFYWH